MQNNPRQGGPYSRSIGRLLQRLAPIAIIGVEATLILLFTMIFTGLERPQAKVKPVHANVNRSASLHVALIQKQALIMLSSHTQNNPKEDSEAVGGKLYTSWLGNSFGQGARGIQMQYDVDGIFVSGDGTVYANTLALDASRMWGVYKDGHSLHFEQGGAFYRLGGAAVTSDGTYLYYAEQQGGTDIRLNANGKQKNAGAERTFFVVRRAWVHPPLNSQAACQSTNPDSACFAGGYGYDGDMLLVESQRATDPPANLMGLAVDPAMHHLYVADTLKNQILVYDTRTMTEIGSPWSGIPNVRSLVWDGSHRLLWAVSYQDATRPAEILALTPGGSPVPSKSITGIADPVALAIDTSGELLVADNGPDQNVKIFGGLSGTPILKSGFGVTGGIYATAHGFRTGEFGDQRFNGLTGVGADAAGNIYVSYDGQGPNLDEDRTHRDAGFGAFVESYNLASGHLNWRVQAQEFFDGVDFDPDTPTNLYGSVFHYSLDYSKAKPGAEWSTIGVTLNRFKYPGDFRLNSTNTNHPLQQVVDYMGHHFLILGDGYHLAIYRFNPRTDGEIAIPAVLFDDTTAPYPIPAPGSTSLSLPAGWKLWTDTNGDGQVQPSEWSTNSNPIPLTLFWGSWVDANLDIRQIVQAKATSYLVTIPMQRLNASGVPIYDFSKITKVALPTLPGGEVWNASGYAAARVQYIEAEDALYISGNTSVHADVPGDGGIGGVLVRFNHWSRGKPCLAWEYPLAEPLLPAANIDKKTDLYDKPIAIRVADDYVFIQYLETYHMRVLDAHTGRILPGILAPDEKVVGDMSHIWVDWKQGVHVIRLTSGEYEVLVEDDIYDKQILYRWTPSRRIRTE